MPRERRLLLEMYQAALEAVNGRRAVREFLRRTPVAHPVYLLAIGKAACAMARGAHDILEPRIADALIVTKHGYAEQLPWPVYEAGHPIPDADSLAAGQRMAEFVAAIPPRAGVLVLLSGGASALIEILPRGVVLADLREANRFLLASGLDIVACNAVRKRLSRIKGGRLAPMLAPRPVLCLAISDVPGDDACAIGSGPLVAGAHCAAALDSIDLPPFLAGLLEHAPPWPVPEDECFRHVRFEIVARLEDATRAAAAAAQRLGYEACVHAEFVDGDAVNAGTRLAQGLLESTPGTVQVWGGETTIRLPLHPGRGGRNQSLALAAARVLRGRERVWFLSAATDGTDGPTADAGALVDGQTVIRGEVEGLGADEALRMANAGEFLEASGDLIQTGPTGTNVMDLMLGLRL
jgi:glycerate 2-kinase